MDDGGIPTLEVGFAIDTSGAFGNLVQLDGQIDSTVANAVAEFDRVKKATAGMVSLGGATANVVAFGSAVGREAQNAARELARVERAGEGLSRQMERQTATFGKTKEEIRAAKVETAALAAEQQGLTELAGRLRAQEAELFAAELAAARQARFEAEAAAEAKQQAAAEAAAAARREAEAVRAAADAYRLFEAVAKQKSAESRDRQAREAAAALQAEAAAAERLAREHAELAALVRGSQAAQEADAVAAEKMRMATDPLYAAVKRLNAEIAESTRLYHSGATAPGEYARQQEVLTKRLKDAADQHDAVAVAGLRNANAMKSVAIQVPDVVQGLLTGQKPMTVLIQQGGQLVQIAMMAEGGLRGMASAIGQVSKAALLAVVTNPILLGIAAAAAAAAATIAVLQHSANEGADMKKYAASLGLTAKEIRHLDDVTVTFGDTAKAVFQVAGRNIWDAIGPAVTSVWGTMKEWLSWLMSAVKSTNNFVIGVFIGAYNAIKATWSSLPAAMGDIFYSTVNTSIEAINWLIRKAVEGVNAFIAGANTVLDKVGLHLPELDAPQIAKVNNQFAGAAAKVGKTFRDEVGKAVGKDYIGGAFSDVIKQAQQNARDRIKKQATEKGYLDPGKPKTDKHAEQLAREAEAVEAQIRNLYALADAYDISGAAALIAEARVKAESDAIKKRGDIEEFVNRQIRLAIAQRVSDAAKSTATMRDQANAQERINAMVAAGTVPAERASELVKSQLADLPLLAAIEAAQQRGLATEAAKATAALADQRAERERLAVAERHATFLAATDSGNQRLAELHEELRLVGATDAARVHALATLKATQEAMKFNPEDRAAYVEQQVAIADAAELLTAKQRAYNEVLSFTADKWDLITRNIEQAGQGMADAFGTTGRAVSDLASAYAAYRANEERAKVVHKANMDAAVDEAAKQREIAKFGLANSTAQVGLYGDLAAAAKSFFKEGSSGYQALATAEKTFRAIQFALSLRAMAQDAIETATSIANSVARGAKYAVEAVAKAIASLPFPLNIAAGAATAAVLASIGLSIAGAFGGGGNKPTPANTGTGTVFGNSSAQSESLKNSIDALKEVDTLTNSYAREMAYSLKSIDNQIGNFTKVILRTGDINASAGVTEGFKMDSTGSLLKGIITGGGILTKIPIIGGIIGGIGSLIGSLFGSTTKVTASGLYGGSQSLGSIRAGGFDASYYSDITKTKKFLGIVTGHSYSTQYSNADPALEGQFTLILRSFADAIGAAAGPLGEATSTIEARLNSFVVTIGKIDLQGLTGDQIQEKLTAIFGAAADGMANAAFPGIAQFQKVGEGAFETLVRVASTVEQVSASLDLLGRNAQNLSIAAKLGLADQFESVSAMADAVNSYFDDYYSKEEQAAAKTAQFSQVFASLGLTMPSTLAAFRALVEAQDLTTAAGQATYATLLQLAPAFADLQSSLAGAKSAADIVSERQDLERQLLELQGNTQAIRDLDLAKLDASNRALQLQIWAIQDAQEAAKAADELRQAWQSVGDSIMDEVKRIRGLSDTTGGNTFASLMGQFNAATAAARAGDMDAAKSLPQLSQALLTAAGNAATSRQELARVQAQTAASLEATYGMINQLGTSASALSDAALLAASADTAQASSSTANDNGVEALTAKLDELRGEIAQLRSENNQGHAATAGNTGAIKRKLDDVTAQSGGDAISTVAAA